MHYLARSQGCPQSVSSQNGDVITILHAPSFEMSERGSASRAHAILLVAGCGRLKGFRAANKVSARPIW